MDFIDQLRSLAARIMNTKDMIQTEEATKLSANNNGPLLDLEARR